jgi:hypothetical protein
LKRDSLGDVSEMTEYKEESAMALGDLLRDRLEQKTEE